MRAFFVFLARRLAPIALLIVAALSISCSDTLFGARHTGYATLAFAPRFTRENAAIYHGLSDFNLQINALRLVVKRPNDTTTVVDTTVSVAPTDTVILLEVKVSITQPEEWFTAALEMKNGSLVLFAGTVNVLAKQTANLDQPPVLVPVWVGPGKTATRVQINRPDTAIAAAGTLPLTATAFDASNVVVSDPEFTGRFQWKVVEAALGSIPAAGGSFTGAGTRGVAHVVVRTPNLLADTIALTLVPPATQIAVISGGGQTDSVGRALATKFVVEVRAADNQPVPNVLVRFSATAGGGSVSPDTQTTNAQGRASTTMTLGNGSVSQTFQAAVQGLTSATVTATALFPPVPSALSVVSGGGQTGVAGSQLPQPFVVLVMGSNNQPFAGALVKFATTGGGSVAPDSAFTDAQGHAQTTMTLGPTSGTQVYEAKVAGLTPVTVSETSKLDTPASIALASHLNVVDRNATFTATNTVKASDGTVLPGVKVLYVSRNQGIATVDSGGTVTGVAKGQTIVVAMPASDTTIRDSLLAVVAEPGGPVVLSSIDRFQYPLDTTMVVSVYVDMRASTKKLGSTTIDVQWNPAQLAYVSHANGASGASPTVNASGASSGTLTLAMADVTGFSGKVELLKITMKTTTTAATGALALTAREVNATDYSDLLPITVQVTHPLRTP